MYTEIKIPRGVTVYLTMDQANLIIEKFKDKKGSDKNGMNGVCEDIVQKMQPTYYYNLKCRDCGTEYSSKRDKILTKKEIDAGGICAYCWDDYK